MPDTNDNPAGTGGAGGEGPGGDFTTNLPQNGLDAQATARRAALAVFTSAEILAELARRNGAESFGWLADLMGQAWAKSKAATDPTLSARHARLYQFLYYELRQRAAQP